MTYDEMRQDFAETMLDAGLAVPNGHPIMDGNRHRVPVIGKGSSNRSGLYAAYLDGHPAGWATNYITGDTKKWKARGGGSRSQEERAQLRDRVKRQAAEKELERADKQAEIADRVRRQIASLEPAISTPYLTRKRVSGHGQLYSDSSQQNTYIPLYDIAGAIRSVQYIRPDGTKRFPKDSFWNACFHAVGGCAGLSISPVLVVCEGYATGDSLRQILGISVVSAFAGWNLLPVAEQLKGKYPNKPIYIAGDDDRHLVLQLGANAGRDKAEAAATAVGGRAVFPWFDNPEAHYPADIPTFTRDEYKAHMEATARGLTVLSERQKAALDAMKQYTDFNDMVLSAQEAAMPAIAARLRSQFGLDPNFPEEAL